MLSKIAANRLMPSSRIRNRLAPNSKNTELRAAAVKDARETLRTRSAPQITRGKRRRAVP
jgi:hypothetical protein